MRSELMSLVTLVMAIVLVSGCARENVVRSEEPVVKATAATGGVSDGKSAVSEPVIKVEQPAVAGSGDPKVPASAAGNLQVNNADVARPFNSIYFTYDSYALSTEARTSLVAIAESLKRQKSVKVRIEGNCDERGADEYNLALGERRAKAAAGYLTLLGVDEARLAIISYGKEKPAVTGHDEASWAKNRRDDIVIVQ